MNGKYIEVSNLRKYFFVFGTVVGTFAGMLALILSLDFLTGKSDFFTKYLTKVIIPLVFIGLGIVQGFKFYKKYFK
jgi:Na+/H+-dicarboxylate symporter